METWDIKSLKFPIDKSSHRNFMSSESFFPNPSCHVTPPGNFCWKIAEPPTWCYPNVWVGKVHLGICQVLPKTVECDLDLLFGKLGLRKCLPGVKNWMIPPRLGVALFCQEVSPELGVRVSSFSDFQPMFSRFLFSGEFFEWPFTEVEAWFPLAFLKTRWVFFPPLAASREKKKQRPFRSFLLGADRTSYQMLCFSQVFRSTVLPRPCRQNWIGWYQLADKLLFLQPQRYQCWVIHKDAWQRKTRIWWGLYTFRVWWPKKSEGCSKFIAGTWTKHGTPLNLWDYLGASCIKTQEKQWKIRVSILKVTNLVPLNWLHTCDFSQFYVPWSHQGWTANTLESTGGKFCRSGKLSGSFCGTT